MSQDVYELMRRDHAFILAGIEQILEHTNGDTARRVKHFRDVKQTFDTLQNFEEQEFYPAARRATGLDAEIDDDMEALDEARGILTSMDGLSPESSEFMEAAQRLHANFRWHADHEERALWNQAKEKLPHETVQKLGDEYARRKGLPLT
ncbi:hypothetical protein C882_2182 [Caenispirillum salinarum AK4]|uniref:Hemerythrin-like domain-containing protein n=1 Tax=Caenispirillum salinarum AK4 TaxID=1238182 RepID=K9H7W7_9PROT|nr:hypothetical protein [Caenispirillum salinarum]EKV26673.1 hypothetical protein C882_2182 [Caenispirillum salinarum AK4]